ncbi:hypothetical protein [Stenotrophomonas sp. PS02301]|uniref:hypothetical protein n=1 Tax=Stenotrophomonas sp. PS02301 TaxID=2991427 RepID=UPI00249C680D|nr:hypothetical protein [Stenotrophomonas sp. PS02301]
MVSNEREANEIEGSGDREWLTVVAFNPAMSFDEDYEDQFVIEQLSAVCKVEYLDDDGDECVEWFEAVLNDRGLHFDGPDSLMDDDMASDYLYECVSSAFEDAIDSRIYDLGCTVDHQVIPSTARDAELTFEMVGACQLQELAGGYYLCTRKFAEFDYKGPTVLEDPAPYYFMERDSDSIIPVHSIADYVSVVNNLDDEFQRLRLQQHVSEVQQAPTEVQRSVQTRRM